MSSSYLISLGIGTPAGVPEFLTFGLQNAAAATAHRVFIPRHESRAFVPEYESRVHVPKEPR